MKACSDIGAALSGALEGHEIGLAMAPRSSRIAAIVFHRPAVEIGFQV
jgi:hypothetical protein